jgi:imidazolonepropionase-like amidohydrolase
MVDGDLVLRGGAVLDVRTGDTTRVDLGIRAGTVVAPADTHDPAEVDAGGLTVMFGLWDCHAHPGGLMYDPRADGYFEGVAPRTVRAGENLLEAASMGVTGVRALGEADGIDIAWARAYAAGSSPGPRLLAAGESVRTTGGHGTAYPREHLRVHPDLVVDGPVEARRAVRSLVERGADWVKLLITGGLYSEHESVDGGQFADDELVAAMEAAKARGIPVAAHCGSSQMAQRFAELGGRSVEHGYALDESAAAALTAAGTWLVPTIGVTHDEPMMIETGWPQHAHNRAVSSAPAHAEALRACVAAGVRIATGADLNPIGPRLHGELAMLEKAGMSRQQVLYATTVGGRELAGLGSQTAPEPGCAADLILVEGDPFEDPRVLRRPRAVLTFGRFVVPLTG